MADLLHVAALSGGKDSTAMVLHMAELGMRVADRQTAEFDLARAAILKAEGC